MATSSGPFLEEVLYGTTPLFFRRFFLMTLSIKRTPAYKGSADVAKSSGPFGRFDARGVVPYNTALYPPYQVH
jgi:hypothetical protein